jgi:hypothetical protein
MSSRHSHTNDLAELSELDAMLMRLPDEIVIAYSRSLGNNCAAQFRLRMGAAIKLAVGLIDSLDDAPVGRARASALTAIDEWRGQRDRVAERLGPDRSTPERRLMREVHGEFVDPDPGPWFPLVKRVR